MPLPPSTIQCSGTFSTSSFFFQTIYCSGTCHFRLQPFTALEHLRINHLLLWNHVDFDLSFFLFLFLFLLSFSDHLLLWNLLDFIHFFPLRLFTAVERVTSDFDHLLFSNTSELTIRFCCRPEVLQGNSWTSWSSWGKFPRRVSRLLSTPHFKAPSSLTSVRGTQ